MDLSTSNSPPVFDWKRWPETEAFIEGLIGSALQGNGFAATLADRMRVETSTLFKDWVDHLVLEQPVGYFKQFKGLGYRRSPYDYAVGVPVFSHEGGIFPRIAVVQGPGAKVREVAIKVESLAHFGRAHDLGLELLGHPLGPYRVARIPGAATSFAAIERRGYLGFEPFPGELAREGRMQPQATRDALSAREAWETRKRTFADDGEGFETTEKTLERVIELAGSRDLACHLVFEVEREYWQSRNRVARVQKERQDRLGLGWANHDHHTFRCSRRYFTRVIRMFESLGFLLRERFHAGEHAGWGAQILEHPTTGIVIFADLDLAPEEAGIDFAHDALPELPRPNTVGLWVGLHGESILDAGMHHLEAQFDFEALRQGLHDAAGIEVMKPFSDFSFLRQAFTVGERWQVAKHRVDRCLALGWISEDQHAKFLRDGAIGSHLENLQRREGYKGFNLNSVSAIIEATDPRRN